MSWKGISSLKTVAHSQCITACLLYFLEMETHHRAPKSQSSKASHGEETFMERKHSGKFVCVVGGLILKYVLPYVDEIYC